MKHPSVFDERDIWGWVYGVPGGLGIMFLIFGGADAKGWGALLLFGVVGSFVLISLCEAFHNWLDRR